MMAIAVCVHVQKRDQLKNNNNNNNKKKLLLIMCLVKKHPDLWPKSCRLYKLHE